MTSNTPDRIWAIDLNPAGVCHWGEWDTSENYNVDNQSQYLLATPARENAEELLEALEASYKMLLGVTMDEASTENMLRFRAAIAKAKGEG